jgi:eukaryotic-like serine/threonine-protein kinase
MATPGVVIHGRYQLSGKPVGQGGMGVVYKAYDVATKRYVALKSMRGALSPAALELFSKEWSVLAHLSHPNIVDVLDTGEFEQDNERRPFFVMPFLPGATLEQLMQSASTRLTPERIVGIVAQACRGLQAAHEQGVIHRDLKPSNIFVMDDDAVKIIDFGIVHLVGADSVTGLKGTLQYMAPEQIEMKPSSPASDVFALAVVCYEALTGRKPFSRKNEVDTADAIRHHIPPAICDLNPLVSQPVGRVIHKAMAKEPWHRFSTAKEFSETLQKALRGEAVERFDRAKIQPRIDRAKKAQAAGDHQFASEILSELEAEGNIDPEMSLLRIQIDQAIRQKSIRQLMESARTRLEEDEFPLALQKIQEVLEIDPVNPDAMSLRSVIEKQRSQRQTENWFRLVDQHIHNGSFAQARQGLEEILKLNPKDSKARDLLVDVDRREKEVERTRNEKEQLYQGAIGCYQRGEVSSALTKLERILDLTRRSPDSTIPDRDAQYQSLYNQIRTERDAARSSYAEGQRYLADRNFSKALELCNEFLKKSPGDPMFQALKLEAEEQQRQDQSSFIAEVSRRAEAERDLDRRVNILKEAVERYPEDAHLQQSLRLVRERRDLVNSIVERARQYEERGQFNEALSQFDILRNIYAQYPGIEFETERLKRRRDAQIREESKGRWVEQIDRQIAVGDYARARELVRTALAEFPEDRELTELERLAEGAMGRAAEAEEWLQLGQKLCFDRQFGEGLEALRKAASLDNRNPVIRAAFLNALVEQARSVLGQDWRAAEPLIEQALNIDGGHPLAKSLQGLVLDYKRQEILNDCVSQARELQANGDLSGALAKVEEGLACYPNEVRLVQLRATLRNLGAVSAAGPAPVVQPDAPTTSPKPGPSAPTQTETMGARGNQARVADSAFTIDRSMATVDSTPQGAPVPSKPQPVVSVPNKRGAGARNLPSLIAKGFGRLPKLLQDWAEPKGRFSKLQWALMGAVPILLVLAMLVTLSHQRGKGTAPPAPVPSEYFVDLEANVANAKYRVDGNAPASLPLRLPPGDHTIEAFLPGYKPAKQTFTLGPGVAKPYVVSLKLEPELVRLRLASGLKSGQVSLDGQPPVELQDGNFMNDGIALSGEHTFALTQAGKESLTFSFRADPGGMVTLAAPIKVKDVSAVVIATLASSARVYASDPSLKGGLKDSTPLPIPPEGLELGGITATTEITLDDGKSQRTVPMEVGNAPTLTVSLANDPNQGTIGVEASVPGAELSLDGRKGRPLHAGRNFRGLEPGTHTIRISKEGYQAVERKVEVKKGETLQLGVIELKQLVLTASLTIEGATREAEVLIDGNGRGVAGGDGAFTLSDLAPGVHMITLRKADFEEKQLSREFTVGQTVRLSGADVQLTQFGSLDFRVTPQNASITYKRVEEAQTHSAENGKAMNVRAGRYMVTATANGSRQRQETVTVEAGKPLPIEWTLLPAAAPLPKKEPTLPPPPPASYFEDSAAWTKDGAWWIHKGADVGWMRDNQGVYLIEFQRQKSGIIKRTRRVDWVIDQMGSTNRIEYSFDFANLERRVWVNGKETNKVKLPAGAASGDSFTFEIAIAPEQIVIRDAKGNELDRYERPNRTLPLGKFGFRNDVALAIKRALER